MDRYFYSIEMDDEKNKVIHLSGNIYCNDVDDTETNHRSAAWTFFYITMDKLKELVKNSCFYEYVNERVNYLGDISEAEAFEACNQYFNGKPGTYLHIEDVSEETPCGDYYF